MKDIGHIKHQANTLTSKEDKKVNIQLVNMYEQTNFSPSLSRRHLFLMSARRTFVMQFGLKRASWHSEEEILKRAKFIRLCVRNGTSKYTGHGVKPLCLICFAVIKITQITLMNLYLHISRWWTSLLNRSRKKVTLLHPLNSVRLLCFSRWIVLECCQLSLSFKRTIITFLFDNYCAMETVN